MAEIALGVAPIFFSACQGFVVLLDKIHLFRHYKKEIHWLRLKVSVQSKCYKDEINRLVIATLDTHKAQSLIADNNHSEWKDPNLEAVFKQYMGTLFPDFLSAVQSIHEALASIQNKLDAFAPPDIKSPRFKAIRDQFKLAFNRDKYKEDIDTLKETIAELKRVRKLADAFTQKLTKRGKYVAKQQRERYTAASDMATHYETVKQYKAVRSLSSSFQDFLQDQWSCCCLSHSHHNGRLFLSCCPSPKQPSLLWLLETVGKQRQSTKICNRFIFRIWSQLPGLLTPDSDVTFEQTRSPKRQRLSPQPATLSGAYPQTRDSLQQIVEENAAASLCKELEAISLQPQTQQGPLIHVDTHKREFYNFEPQQITPAVPKGHQGSPPSSILSAISSWDLHEITYQPLSHLLAYKPEYVMLRRERIQLAAMLVRVTLIAHSTAGWPGHQSAAVGCILEGIYFFIQGGVTDTATAFDIQNLLNTLHISVQVGNSTELSKNASSDTNMTDGDDGVPLRHAKAILATDTVDGTNTIEQELKLTYGVRNLVLYRLGVALLSIARWERVRWQDIASVRKKVAALDWGGEVYKTAVKRLIDCDFGAGDDLEDEKLQFEVVRGVVGPLENNVAIISRSIGFGDSLSRKNLDKVEGVWLEEPDRWVSQFQYETYPSQDAMGEPSTWVWPPQALDEIGEVEI